ncbi:MAG: hypothetical protein M3022_09670 [Actinomycetota bacterium]|nr:hypothetical protein [Actinomycetota bacterium]
MLRRRLARRRRRFRRLVVVALVIASGVAITFFVAGVGGSASRRTVGRAAAIAARLRSPKPVLLPRGGRRLFPGHRIVAYYGIAGTSNVLGRTLDPEADAAGVERAARAFARFGRPVRPAFELVTTIASPEPGPDGTYSSPIATATLDRYVAAAHRHKLLLILDFQPGRGQFLPEVRRYERLLLNPGVGVALDPEWKLTASEVPNQVIGTASADAINAVSAYLSRLVIVHHLPQKLFIVHEFQLRELPDRGNIRIRRGLGTVLQMDGLGPVSTKLASYRQVMAGARAFHPGFKVFLRPSDDPMKMTPAQVMALHPQPDYVSYQ